MIVPTGATATKGAHDALKSVKRQICLFRPESSGEAMHERPSAGAGDLRLDAFMRSDANHPDVFHPAMSSLGWRFQAAIAVCLSSVLVCIPHVQGEEILS